MDAGSIAAGTADQVTLDSSALVDVQAQVVDDEFRVVMSPRSSVDIGGVMGQALDAALNPNSGEEDSVQEIVDVLNQPEEVVAEIGEQVKPDTTGHQQQLARDLALSSQNIIFDRNQNLRSGLNFGDSLFRFGGGGLWGQMVYIDGNQDERDAEAGYNNRLGGIILGVDVEFTKRLRLGIAATYGVGTVNTENNHSIESQNFLGTIYSSWEYQRYFVDTMLSMGGARNQLNQHVVSLNSKATADYDSNQWNVRFVTGARLPLGRSWEFTPLAELNYGQVSFDSYTQQGEHSLQDQQVQIKDYSALELGLGFTLNGQFNKGRSSIRPDLTLMAHRDLNTTGVQVQYSYLAGGTTSSVSGPARDPQRYKIGFGLNFDMNDSFTVRTAYDYRMSNTYRSHNLNAKFRYDF